MRYFVQSYLSDFSQAYKRLAFNVVYNDNSVTSQEDDLAYLPSSLLSSYESFVNGLGYCAANIRLRSVRIYINTELYLTAPIPFYPYDRLIDELNEKDNIQRYMIIGERITNPFLFERYTNVS